MVENVYDRFLFSYKKLNQFISITLLLTLKMDHVLVEIVDVNELVIVT
jgi:hypothetical protein